MHCKPKKKNQGVVVIKKKKKVPRWPLQVRRKQPSASTSCFYVFTSKEEEKSPTMKIILLPANISG